MAPSDTTWIKLTPEVFYNPKIAGVARELGLTHHVMVEKLAHLWSWCRKREGFLCDVHPKGDPKREQEYRMVARAARYPSGPRLVNALFRWKLIDRVGDRLFVHDWSAIYGPSDTLQVVKPPAKKKKSEAPAPEDAGFDEYGVPRWPFGRFMWWLKTGFGFSDYQRSLSDVGILNRENGIDMAVAAECYIAIAKGIWGDQWDQRNLTAAHAVKKANAFKAMKARRHVDGYVVPITPEGAAVVSAGGAGPRLAGEAPEVIAGRSGGADQTPDDYDSRDLANHPKVVARRNRAAGVVDDWER